MSAPEAMKYLGVSRNTLYDWVRREIVPHRWEGDRWRLRFDKAKLDAWLDK
jgi:excisionase family DNA binding protein